MAWLERNGHENGKSAYLVKKRFAGLNIAVGTIVFEKGAWVLRSGLARTDRFEKLAEARNEALKL